MICPTLYLWSGAPLQLGLDVPGQVGFAVFVQDLVGADGVKVFGVYEQAVHVEKAGAHWR